MSSSEKNKIKQGEYYRNIISRLNDNIKQMELDRKRYGRIRRFVFGINRNLRKRKQRRSYYEDELKKAIKRGWAI